MVPGDPAAARRPVAGKRRRAGALFGVRADPDGKQGDGQRTDSSRALWSGHEGSVYAVAVSPDGKTDGAPGGPTGR